MRTHHRKSDISSFLRTPVAIAVGLALAQGAAAVTYTVTNANESGAGSLAQAISDANANCATDGAPVIHFSGPFTISPSIAMPPPFSCSTSAYNPTIDASTTPGAVANSSASGFNATLPIVIDLASFFYGGGSCILEYDDLGYGGSLTIKGLEIRNYTYGGGGHAACGRLNVQGSRFNNTGSGLSLSGGSTVGGSTAAARNVITNMPGIGLGLSPGVHSVVNNLLGTPDGATAAPNGIGIQLNCCNGSGTIDSNVIVSNGSGNIFLSSDNTMLIQNNMIGTDATGTNLLANSGFGIALQFSYGAQIKNNVIAGQGTAISNSGESCCGGFPTTNVFIYGNTIGNTRGNAQLANTVGISDFLSTGTLIRQNDISGNTSVGIQASCTPSLTVDRNTIGNNMYGGLLMSAVQTSSITGNTIAGSLTDAVTLTPGTCSPPALSLAKAITTGSNNEPNGNSFSGNSIANNGGIGLHIVGGNGNSIFQNSIYSNTADGLRIDSDCCVPIYGGNISDAVGNSILENLIYSNGGKNINLGFDGGILPNDSLDADSGHPNNWQNWPVLNSAAHDVINNWTTIGFTLDSKAGQYRIDFFANASPSKVPGGQTYLGNTFLTIAADGPTPGSYSVNGISWDNISAVATRAGPEIPAVQDSSEFADEVAATTLPYPTVNVNPTSIDFGDVVVGRSSANSSITVSSTGTADYVISALRDGSCAGPPICSSGAFFCSTSCIEGSPYRPGMSCSITAAFGPTTAGPQSKALALCDNALGSPRMLTLSGNGIPPPTVDISYTPGFDSFGQILVGTQSASHSFTLTNAGASQVFLSSASTAGDFLITGNTCGATLAPGASCKTDVAFAPATQGGQNGRLQVTGSNVPLAKAAATALAVANLQGSGVQFGDLRLPPSLGFGTLVLHSSAASLQLPLTNTGNGPLAIGSITISGPFTMTNNCGPSLAVGASCTVLINFVPASLGSFNGVLTVVSDAPGGSRAIALSAQVIAIATPLVRVAPVTIGFGARLIGTTSPASRVTVTNEGAQAALLGTMTFAQPEAGQNEYSISGTNCPASLAPQANCFVDLVFKPLGFGSRVGQFIVPSNSADSPQTVSVNGTGCRPFAPGINRAPRDPCAP